MNVEFTGRNIVVTDDLRSFTRDKLSRLERIVGNLSEVHVILTTEKHRQMSDIVARGRNITLSAAEETDDLYTAIARSIDKLARQANKQKGSRVARRRGRSRPRAETGAPPVETPAQPVPAESAAPRVIASDRYALKPMYVEEAALQLQAIDDSFLVFRNAESQRVSVLYRRPDGNLGIIEPEN